MTRRLYYDDSLLTEFDAMVTGCVRRGDSWACTLDRSAFYPTSGGQPHDTGTIACPDGHTCSVTDVECDRDGEVWHTISEEIPSGTKVRCVIDWERRRDHMEQHGGEHLLAGAVWRHLHGTTIGLHLGKEDSTIDVSFPDGRTHLTEEEITLLEKQVNSWIRLDAPVKCYFADPSEVPGIPLRKPPTVSENIRIVQYGDFEYCACGGTHPPRSGMIGQIKILSALPSKGKVRISFVCGERAEIRLHAGFQVLKALSDALSCHWADTPDAVRTLQERNEELAKEGVRKNEIIARYEAERACRDPVICGGKKIALVLLPLDDKKFLTRFAADEAARMDMIIFAALKPTDGVSFFCICRPDSAPVDLRKIIAPLKAKGGGREEMVQGTVPIDDIRTRLAGAFLDL
ncbi:MAG: hypothetical protein IKP22_03290 [Clostridia bacterium]|nr:hypothetical protein [Clostridia bacterium]